MPDHETQIRLAAKRGGDLQGEIVHHIQERGVRPGLVRDERPAQFEENKLFHGPILSHSREEAV